jgi:hypothetical protein
MISLAVVITLCTEMIPSAGHYAAAGEQEIAVTEGVTVPCPQLDWATIRSLPNTGNADDPARPDFLLSPQEKKDAAQSRANLEKWLAQHSSETTVDEPIKSGALTLVTPYQYSIAMPARTQETGDWCGVASTQMVSDYEWGYTGNQSKYSQQLIANWEGATKDGVSSTAIKDFLNNHPAPYVTWTWVRDQPPYAQGEPQAATALFDTMNYNIQHGHGTVMSLNPYVGGSDVWGDPYRLIGWYAASKHFVAGYGVSVGSDNRHRVMYIDSWETKSGGSLGPHTIDAAVMVHLMADIQGYLVH